MLPYSTRVAIETEIQKEKKDYGLKANFQTHYPHFQGVKFITISGEEALLNVPGSHNKTREKLIQDFKKALLTFNIPKLKQLVQKNDSGSPFITYALNGGYVIRENAYSIQELFYKNPLPMLLKAHLINQEPMRFDEYWSLAQYCPMLGTYNTLRHFENYFSSSSSSNRNYSLGLAYYMVRNIQNEKKIRIIELGAGTGEGMFQLLTALKYIFTIPYEVFIVETSETLKLTQRHKLQNFNITWVETIEEIPSDKIFVFLTCEMVLDSFPFRAFKKIDQHYHEIYIKEDDIIYNEKGLTENDPMIAEIENVKTWPNHSIIYRSFLGEAFLEKITQLFKRFIFLICDHTTSDMNTTTLYEKPAVQMSLHLVGLNQKPQHLLENVGSFMMACSLYLPLYKRILDRVKNIEYKFHTARDFFKVLGNFDVCTYKPRFVMMEIKSKR